MMFIIKLRDRRYFINSNITFLETFQKYKNIFKSLNNISLKKD